MAASFAYRFLTDKGYAQTDAAKIHDIIMATNPEVRPPTADESIIQAADLWNIGSTFEEFKAGSIALHEEEAQIARRQEIPFAQWMRGAYRYRGGSELRPLTSYLKPSLKTLKSDLKRAA